MPTLKVQYSHITDERPYKVFSNQQTGKYIGRPKKMGKSSLAVLPCISHEGAVVVPVELVTWDKDRYELKVWGTGKACPLCWEVLKRDE